MPTQGGNHLILQGLSGGGRHNAKVGIIRVVPTSAQSRHPTQVKNSLFRLVTWRVPVRPRPNR